MLIFCKKFILLALVNVLLCLGFIEMSWAQANESVLFSASAYSYSGGSVGYNEAIDSARERAKKFAVNQATKYLQHQGFNGYMPLDQKGVLLTILKTEVIKAHHQGNDFVGVRVFGSIPLTPRSGGQRFLVTVGSKKKEYVKGENISFFFKGESPFYGCFLYASTTNETTQLFPNALRPSSLLKSRINYVLPDRSEGEKYQFKVSPPYGQEKILFYGSNQDFPALFVDGSYNGAFGSIKLGVNEIRQRIVDNILQNLAGKKADSSFQCQIFAERSEYLTTSQR